MRQIYHDDTFGVFEWNDQLDEWHGTLLFPPHGEVTLAAPVEYVEPESEELRAHVRRIVDKLRHTEQSYRKRAAGEIFADDYHHMWWPEDQPFDRDEFARQMGLASIEFNTEFPDEALTLGYEYGGGMEHGLSISLTWDGEYRYVESF